MVAVLEVGRPAYRTTTFQPTEDRKAQALLKALETGTIDWQHVIDNEEKLPISFDEFYLMALERCPGKLPGF